MTADGRDDATDDLARRTGVTAAPPDSRLALEEPAEGEQAAHGDPASWDVQWDEHVTAVERAHETATGEYAAEQGADAANVSLGAGPFPPRADAGGIRAVIRPTPTIMVWGGFIEIWRIRDGGLSVGGASPSRTSSSSPASC